MPIIGSSKLQITGDITASGAIVAEEFKTDFVSGSILYNSGSSKFGDTFTNYMNRYGQKWFTIIGVSIVMISIIFYLIIKFYA